MVASLRSSAAAISSGRVPTHPDRVHHLNCNGRKSPWFAKFSMADTALERSLGQEADIFAGNLIDRRHGGPITIGYGRYAPNQSLSETLAVDDVMVILEAELSSRSAKAPSPRAPVRSY